MLFRSRCLSLSAGSRVVDYGFDSPFKSKAAPIWWTPGDVGPQRRESDGHMALAMLGEGVEPESVEHAGSQAGYPAPPLQLSDELLDSGLCERLPRLAQRAVQVEALLGARAFVDEKLPLLNKKKNIVVIANVLTVFAAQAVVVWFALTAFKARDPS